MIRTNSNSTTSTYSPAPTSPFSSNYSVPSEPTSDETPDLGAFTAVLRAWSHLQPPPRVVNSTLANANAQQDVPSTSASRTNHHTLSSNSFSFATRSRNLNLNNDNSELESDSDIGPRDNNSTVWAHRRIANYLNSYGDPSYTTDTETDRDRPVSVFSSETAGEPELGPQNEPEDARGLIVPIQDMDELDSSYDNEIYDDDDGHDHNDSIPEPDHEQELSFEPDDEDEDDGRTPLNMDSFGDSGIDLGEQPSLGYLDEALKFIAAERERFNAQREAGIATGLTTGIEPRKRRRRKRTKTPRAHSTTRTTTTSSSTTAGGTPSISILSTGHIDADDGDPDDADADESSSSYDHNYSTSYSTSNYTSSSAAAAAVSRFKSAPGTPGASSRRARGRDRRQRQMQHQQYQLPTNPNPALVAGGPGKQRQLKHSRSTPQLRIHPREDDDDEDVDEVIESPRIAQLRALGKRLEKLFPEDKEYLRRVGYTALAALQPPGSGKGSGSGQPGYFDSTLYPNSYGAYESPTAHPRGGYTSFSANGDSRASGSGSGGLFEGFIDTRGPPPLLGADVGTSPSVGGNSSGSGSTKGKVAGSRGKGADRAVKRKSEDDERLIHVFVDHSNILIGLINYLKRNPQKHPQSRDIGNGSGNDASYAGSPYPKPPKHLSHSALTLILERGRPVTRRILVTSSPLYQPMESAAMLGYEVKVFARVPDFGEGLDREKTDKVGAITNGVVENGTGRRKGHKKNASSGSFSGVTKDVSGASGSGSGSANDGSPKKTRKRAGSVNDNHSSINGVSGGGGTLGRRKSHKRQTSGSNSTESEQGTGSVGADKFPEAFVRSLAQAASSGTSVPTSGLASPAVINGSNGASNSNSISANLALAAAPTPQRIRYREQGVDELLQLKLHQVLAALDGPPPPGSTIILVTGDGNAGQFNEDGFLGGVRTALKKGWKVELYAWEGGLSRAWKREFGEGSELGSGFRIFGLEQFGTELVEIYY